MALVLTDEGLKALLLLGRPFLTTLTMHLFVNDVTPAYNSEFYDFIIASWPGYSSQQVDEWSNPYMNADGIAEMDSVQVRFIQTGPTVPPQVVYGFVLVDSSLRLIGADRTEPVGYPMSFAPLAYGVTINLLVPRL